MKGDGMTPPENANAGRGWSLRPAFDRPASSGGNGDWTG
jgi:hypothetical protein